MPATPPRKRPFPPIADPAPVVLVRVNDLWRVEFPPIGNAGPQVFQSNTLEDLIQKLCKSLRHAQAFICILAEQIRAREAEADKTPQ
jgi:hypothetical protein